MGRRPKPAALREAQGNPGRRPIPAIGTDETAPGSGDGEKPVAAAKPARSRHPLSFAKVSLDARKVYDLIAPQLRRLNFLRDSDEPAFWRYCETLARYWRVTATLNELGGETYQCATTGGGVMGRMRPEFMVQERLAKRLDGLEDRFGLTPMARQQYMMALQRQPMLPLDQPAPKQAAPDQAATNRPAKPAAIGGLRGPLN